MTAPVCPISGHSMKPWISVPGDWRVDESTEEPFDLYWCEESGYGCLYPALDDKRIAQSYDIDDYYTHASAKDRPKENESFFSKLRVALAWRADFGILFDAHWVNKIFRGKKNLSICDIGCGDGNFILKLHECGYKVMGVEIDTKARAIAEKNGLLVYSGTAEILPEEVKNKKFDLIIMSHVLEHVKDPLLSLKNAGALLSNEGLLVVEVPNNACLAMKASAQAWYHFDVPRHLHFFTEKSLKFSAVKAGLEVMRVEYSGYTRQFCDLNIEAERYILDQFNKRCVSVMKSTPRNSPLRSMSLLLKSIFAANRLKYDSVRILLKKSRDQG